MLTEKDAIFCSMPCLPGFANSAENPILEEKEVDVIQDLVRFLEQKLMKFN